MNYDNNDSSNMEPAVAPVVPEEAQTPVAEPVVEASVEPTPVVEATPAVETAPVEEPTVEPAPVVETPVEEAAPAVEPTVEPAPAVEPTVEPAPAVDMPADPGMPSVEPTPMPGDVPPVNPPMDGPMMGGTEPMPGTEPEKKNNTPIIIAIVAIVVIGLGVGAYFIFSGKDEEPAPTPTNNTTVDDSKEKEFLALANKYVDAAKEMWTGETVICQDLTKPKSTKKDNTDFEMGKPTTLPDADSWGGNASYYFFIDTNKDDEINFGISNSTKVAGWVRVIKKTGEYYVALSDGTNYIIDKGTDFDFKASEVTTKDVHTDGNGYSYQYYDGNIYGSATDGEGWGIGDYQIILDGDDTNNGSYLTWGPKSGGMTPYCVVK